MRSAVTRPLHRLVVTLAVTSAVAASALTVGLASPADAATITVSYQAGHRDVLLNDYRAAGLGTFVLRTDPGDPQPGTTHLALCIDAAVGHSTAPGAYRLADNRLTSPQLDYLLWRYGVPGHRDHVQVGADHDTATALAALAWYYAGVTRRGGGLVWADWSKGFSPVSPVSPHRWDALARFSSSFPVGVRAGGRDLDQAERRVYELYVEAEARRGPWSMSPVRVVTEGRGATASVTVTGPAGPLAGLRGVRAVVRDHDGRVVADTTVSTNRDGIATVGGLVVPRGGTVEFSTSAPGVHREWDGGRGVQRMTTGTETRLERRAGLPAAPVHVRVVKQSSDPTIAVSGARFGLVDATGTLVATSTSGADGVADFGPIDPGLHRPPYAVRELAAPGGLMASDRDHPVGTPYSTDADRPTVVSITNHPAPFELRVRKHLSDEAVGPQDRSGFGFSVTRLADRRPMGTVQTLADGRSDTVSVTVGRYEICEVERPRWAEILVDPGCQLVTVAAGDTGPIEVTYTNVVPHPWMTSRARDRDDGDQLLERGGVLVDTVTVHDAVPGTVYALDGEIVGLATDGAPVHTGITATAEFLAESSTMEIDMAFELPADAGFSTGIVIQRLRVGDSEVAVHDDLDDADQTFWIPDVTSSASVVDATIPVLGQPGDTLVDVVDITGLPPGSYEARLVWHRRDAPGRCAPTGLTSSALVHLDGPSGGWAPVTTTVGPVLIPDELAGSTLVAFQHVHRVDDGELVAAHADCEESSQTVWLPELRTSVADPQPIGTGVMTDTITVTGLPDALPPSWSVAVVGGLHRHDDPDRRSCTSENLVAAIRIPITGNGRWDSPGEAFEPGTYSYQERVEIVDGDRRWASRWHGCHEADQTFHAVAASRSLPPVVTTPATSDVPAPDATTPEVTAPAPAVSSRPPTAARPLPRTGGMVDLSTALALLASGAGGLIMVGSARRGGRR